MGAWAEGWHDAGDPAKKKLPTRSMMTRSFVKACAKQAGHARPWTTVRGPAGAVVATLRRILWKAECPSLWVTDRGEAVNLDEVSPLTLKKLVDDATERYVDSLWAREVGDPTLKAGVWTKPITDAIARAPQRVGKSSP